MVSWWSGTWARKRIQDYLGFGVSFVWIVDPYAQAAWIYTADGTSRQVRDGILRTDNPQITVPLSEVFK
jgi:hypothetical protein